MQLNCPECLGHNDEQAEHCAHCGAALWEEEPVAGNGNFFADLSLHRGHTAAFLQLNDILTAELSPDQTRSYLEDLAGYLDRECQRFERMPAVRHNANYNEGVALVLEGLSVLQAVVVESLSQASPPADWLEVAMEADLCLRDGTDLLAVA